MGRLTFGRRVLLAAALIALGGCGSILNLSAFDFDTPDAGPDSAVSEAGMVTPPPLDAGEDAGDAAVVLPAVTCTAAPGACAAVGLDGGWSPVALTPGVAGCPEGFAAANVVQGNAVAGPGACDCAVDTTTSPLCNVDRLDTLSGNAANDCAVNGQVPFNGTGCSRTGGEFARSFALFEDPTPTRAATCTAKVVTQPSAVVSAPITLCAPTTCTEQVCARGPLGALRACIAADGDVPCPAGPFSEKIAVGDAVDEVSCSACTCGVASQSCGGQVRLFTNPVCGGSMAVVPIGVCTQVGGQVFESVQYVPAPSATYDAGGPKTASGVTFASPRTVCCAR